jgi:hypothetical protein
MRASLDRTRKEQLQQCTGAQFLCRSYTALLYLSPDAMYVPANSMYVPSVCLVAGPWRRVALPCRSATEEERHPSRAVAIYVPLHEIFMLTYLKTR